MARRKDSTILLLGAIVALLALTVYFDIRACPSVLVLPFLLRSTRHGVRHTVPRVAPGSGVTIDVDALAIEITCTRSRVAT